MRTKIVHLASSLLHRLYFEEANNDNDFDVEIEVETETEVCSNEEETDRKRTLEESFNEFMSKSSNNLPANRSTTGLGSTSTQAERIIKKEMSLFESTKKRPENLEKLFKALKTIPPTSIEAERAFSTAGIFITKLRNRLSAKTINALIFLKHFFKKNEEK
jgi:hypothetical protein